MATRIAVARLARPACSISTHTYRAANVRPLAPTTRTSIRLLSAGRTSYAKKYTEDHEWIELDSDGTTGTIGVSTYAAKALGDVVYVELPQPDTTVAKGDTLGAVESVKSASDILAPVGGTIIEANNMLEDKPGMINKSPEGEGWIAKIKVKDTGDLDGLMDKAKYDDFTEGEGEAH